MTTVSQVELDELIQRVKDFFDAQSLQTEPLRTCPRCGATLLQFLDAMFWLDGSDSGWNLRVPLCPCDRLPAV